MYINLLYYTYTYVYTFEKKLPRNLLTATCLLLPHIKALANNTSPNAPLPITLTNSILFLGNS